jgi:poly-gamma-glutamate synthesis protein (capsule biosynthesis protein)
MKSDVSIVVAGDLCPKGETEYLLCANQPEKVFSDLLPYIIESQLAIVNLECPLTYSQTPIIKRGPHLQAAPACAEGIRSGGFDVVTLANNHILDMGERGLFDTLSTCHAAGLKTVGAGKNLEEAMSFLSLAPTKLAHGP